MSFPQTSLTLVQRLAAGGSETDWQMFLKDYWGPVCRFALRWGAANADEAEDVAAETFELLWKNRLLARWAANRCAKLRTLLCAMVRNNLSNRSRRRSGNEQSLDRRIAELELSAQPADQLDAFYAAWADDIVQRSVRALAVEYAAQGKADYLRVLYGRLCQGLTIAECAASLGLTASAVDHYFRHARDRLAVRLEQLVRAQVERYVSADEAAAEFAAEWSLLGDYLAAHGGLDEAVGRAHDALSPGQAGRPQAAAIAQAATRFAAGAAPDVSHRPEAQP